MCDSSAKSKVSLNIETLRTPCRAHTGVLAAVAHDKSSGQPVLWEQFKAASSDQRDRQRKIAKPPTPEDI